MSFVLFIYRFNNSSCQPTQKSVLHAIMFMAPKQKSANIPASSFRKFPFDELFLFNQLGVGGSLLFVIHEGPLNKYKSKISTSNKLLKFCSVITIRLAYILSQ